MYLWYKPTINTMKKYVILIVVAVATFSLSCKKTTTTPSTNQFSSTPPNTTASMNSLEVKLVQNWKYKRSETYQIQHPGDSVLIPQWTTNFNNPLVDYMNLLCTADTMKASCINAGYKCQNGSAPFGSYQCWKTNADSLYFVFGNCSPSDKTTPYTVRYLTADSLILQNTVSGSYFSRYYFHR